MTSIAVASMLVGVRQQGQEARALDAYRELALIERLRTRDAAGNDLARFGDVTLQRSEILVIDLLDAFGREATELLAARETATAAAPTTSAAATTTAAAATAATATAV